MWLTEQATWSSRAWSSSTINVRRMSAGAGLAVLLGLALVVRFPADDLRLELSLLFKLAAAGGLALYLLKINPWWSAFVTLAGLSHLHPAYTQASYLAFDGVLYGALWFAVVVSLVRRDDLGWIYNTLCVLALINVFWQTLQVLDLDPIFAPAPGMTELVACGLMMNVNFTCAFLAMCVPAFLRPKWIWGLVPLGLGLIMARTSLGVFSAGAGLMAYGVLKGRLKLSLALAVAGAACYVLVVDGPGFERWAVWKLAMRGWWQEPLFGFGLGHWAELFTKPVRGAGSGIWVQAHNEYLQGLFEMGIGFAVVVVGYAWHVVRWCRIASRSSLLPAVALVIVAVNSGANFPFHVGTTAIVAITWMAVFEIETKHARGNVP